MRLSFVVIALSSTLMAAGVMPNPAAIIQRSVEANDRDWQEAPKYSYFELDRKPGKGTETYQVLMVDGSPYERLVAVNSAPLSPDKQKAEQKQFEDAIARRKAESPQERAQRIARYEKGRKRDHLLMTQLSQAFDFKLLGLRKLEGHTVYLLRATPRPGYRPPNMETEVLTGMEGYLWIDTRTYQWVKVEAVVTHPVSIEGFLARVEPGTRFELQKMPVAGNVWLPKRFLVQSNVKVLGVFSHDSHDDETYFNYQRQRS